MSLIHWWPLNGDTQDKITNTQLTNNGAAIVDNGKIGRCYTFNGSTNLTISYPSLNTLGSNPTKFSFALWIKINSTWTGWGQVFTIGRNGGAWTDIRIGFDVASDKTGYFTVSDGSSATSYSGPKHALTVGKWHHVAATFDNKKMKLFIDGQPASTPQATASVLPNLSSDTFITIGGNGGENGECDMNDVRVYDHVLSEAEVKELAKALVVHYTFDDILAEPTTNIDPCKDSLTTQNFPNTSFGAISRTYGNFHGFDCVEMYLNTTYSSDVWLYMNSNPITQGAKVGDTVTRSCWMYIPSGQTKPPHFTESIEGNSSGKTFIQYDFNKCDTWQKISMTGTIKDTGTNNYLHYFMAGSGTINFKWYMRDFQMEIKDHATPYTPTSRNSFLHNETGLIQPNTLNNVNLTTDSKSGTLALKCQGSTQIICTNTSDATQGVTASFWVKCSIPSDSRLVFADNNSKIAFGFFNNGQAIITCGGYGHAHVSNIRTNWSAEWNHIIVRKTSSNVVDCYINGVKQALSGWQEWTHSSTNSLSIGCRYSDGWTSYFTGLIDDFRYYNTCLSDNDILDLYKTKAYVTDKGDMETYQFIEGCADLQITHNGCAETHDIQEVDNAEYEQLEYIASTGTQYIDTGVYWTSEKATIVADLMVTAWKASSTIFGSEERYSGSSRYFAHILHAGSANGNYANYIGTTSHGATTSLTKDTRYVLEYIAHGNNTFSTKTTNHSTGEVKIYNNKVSYNGTILTHQNSTQTAANKGHIYIFSNHNAYNGTAGIQNMSAMRLYRFTMIQDDKYIRDFIPCKRKSDSKVGLFDLVTGQFYTSPTGNFTAGNVVINEDVTAKFLSGGSIQARQFVEI